MHWNSILRRNNSPSTTPAKWHMWIKDADTDEVPGSVLIYSQGDSVGNESASKTTPDGKITLNPQPDDSLNDPLNWAQGRRDAALASLGFYCMMGGGMVAVVAAGFNNVAKSYGIPEEKVALTTGLYMLGLGIGGVLLSPTAILFGKRLVYLVAAAAFALSSVWCALSPSFGSLIAARIFMGIAVSSVEVLPSATISEIYFLHEKGYRLGLYTMVLLGGKNLIPVASAAIIQTLGWRWVFWIVAIIVGAAGLMLFLFVPETHWDRTPTSSRQRRKTVHKAPSSDDEKRRSSIDDGDDDKKDDDSPMEIGVAPDPASNAKTYDYFRNRAADQSAAESQTQSVDCEDARNEYTKRLASAAPRTRVQTLKPCHGLINKDNWFKAALRPFLLFAYPSILWSALVYALSIGWLVVVSESITPIYKSRSEYNFTSLQAGLVYISPFIGAVLGTAVAGKASDILVRYMARKNNGMYEPEFRLIMAIPIAITTVIGLMGYGWAAGERDAWIVPTVFFGIISFGCSLGSTVSITFALDSYRKYAGEALVTLNFSKNIFHGLVFSLFFNNWLDKDGSKSVFLAIGGIQLAFMFTTIPMYMYGKRARAWGAKKNFMAKL